MQYDRNRFEADTEHFEVIQTALFHNMSYVACKIPCGDYLITNIDCKAGSSLLSLIEDLQDLMR